MFYFYILKSGKTGKYYIGSTKNFDNRFKLHNSGKIKSTKSSKPWLCMLVQNFPNLKEAVEMELRVKKWKSRKAVERLIKTFNF